MDDRTDEELVRRARQGDKEAFGTLAGRYQGTAQRIARRMTSQEEAAQELVQEAMLQAYLSLDRLRDPQRFKSWFFGIVLNQCRSWVRARMRRENPRGQAHVWDLQAYYSSLPDPHETAEERELHRRMLSAVHELPDSQRKAALLFYYEYLSVQEVAALLGISVGAVKVRLNRARSSVRQRLVQQYPEFDRPPAAERRRKRMVQVSIVDVIKWNDMYIMLLKDEAANRVLPIWIGAYEGISIALGLRSVETARPMTFNFIAKLIETLGAELEEARIETLQENTFFGVAKLKRGRDVYEVDARPSDVLALSVRTGSPIFVAEDILERVGQTTRLDENGETKIWLGQWQGNGQEFPVGHGIDAILEDFQAMMRPPAPEECE